LQVHSFLTLEQLVYRGKIPEVRSRSFLLVHMFKSPSISLPQEAIK